MAPAPEPSSNENPSRLSVVIPVFRDIEALRRLIPLLTGDQASEESRIDECIVVAAETDRAALDDALAGIARVIESPAGRGRQLNAGARAASGDLLWFLHADATPPSNAPAMIRSHVQAGHDGGWFRFRFEGVESRGATRLAALINWRARHGIAYGDQGLFFRRDAFLRWGGFEEIPLFEEVRLVRRAKAEGAFAESPCEIGVDPRRWRQSGWVRRTLVNRALALGHAVGVSPKRLARWYSRW